MSDDLKKNMLEDREVALNKMRSIDFQVDTLSNSSSSGAYYTPRRNTITIEHFLDDESKTRWSGSVGTLVHEQKHRDNANQGIHAYAMSVEQAYKACMHNEISANMAELIYWRNEYIKTGDIAVLEDYRCNSLFGFYTKAVKSGEINPFSNSKEDFDKEMSLIANGTRDMWERRYASTQYLDDHCVNAKIYGEKDGKHAEFYDENYERAKKIAYTIGGVDFTQYMDKDAEIPIQAKTIILGDKFLEQQGFPKYDGKMSLLQYQKLLQHALVMKDPNVGINSKELFTANSEMTKGEFHLDMGAYSYLTEGKLDDSAQEFYKEALDNIAKEDKKLIEGVIDSIAKDYELRGEKLPEDNDKAYNDAVDKLYTGKVKFNQEDLKYEGEVNLRKAFNPNDELPLKELPKQAKESQQKLEDMGMWGRGVKQYGNFFVDGLDYDKVANLPYGLRYPAEVIGVGIGAPVVAGCKKVAKLGEDCVDMVKGWFVEVDKNEPVRPVKEDNTPQYHEWSEEKRVSPVQQKEILNLMADVIEKPTNQGKPDGFLAHRPKKINQEQRKVLKKDMQNEAKEKARMIKVVEGMNRINGAKNSMDVGKTVNTLYDKFGDNAYELLVKAVNEPFNFAQDIGDSTIRTSREAVKRLCDADEGQKSVIISSMLNEHSR